MKYVTLSNSAHSVPLPFYLAMEEYLARVIDDDDLWFTWIVDPTVIIGRNQIIDKEVDLDYCRTTGISVFRRKSGGGCVYADQGNIMFSYVCRSNNVSTTFSRYTSRMTAMLHGLGLDAEATGRNDILVNGLKVSGNAYYHLPGRSIVHGTMLYDTNFEYMTHAIRPPVKKLKVYGVESVRQRITTLKPLISLTRDEFVDYARRDMSDGEILLGQQDVTEIEKIMASYLTPEWIAGRRASDRATLHESARVEGVGEIEVSAVVNKGVIGEFRIYGDFFALGDLNMLYDRMNGTQYTRRAVSMALDGLRLRELIAGLENDVFINLIF